MDAYVKETAASPAPRPALPPHILIVDDDETILDLLEDLLSSTYQVSRAPGGAEALRSLADRNYDLILLDLGMPGIDGFEVLRRVRADPSCENTPVIILSAFPELRGLVPAESVQAVEAKPFDIAQLLRTIGRVIGGE